MIAAAIGLALAGIVVAITRDDDGPCDQLRNRLTAIEAGRSDEALQTWDDVMEGQDAITERARIRHALTTEGCT